MTQSRGWPDQSTHADQRSEASIRLAAPESIDIVSTAQLKFEELRQRSVQISRKEISWINGHCMNFNTKPFTVGRVINWNGPLSKSAVRFVGYQKSVYGMEVEWIFKVVNKPG